MTQQTDHPIVASRHDRSGVLTITMPGTPIGKPRWQKSDTWKPRPCIVAYRAWADHLRLIAKPIPSAALVLRLDWTAYFVPPPSWSKKKRAAMLGQQHRQVPDRDNIDKAVLDALWPRSKKVATGGQGDDSAIAAGTIGKWWAEHSYLEIRIRHEES